MTLEHKLKRDEEEKLKKEACKISIKEGSAYSLMDGFGLRYIAPYAIALGANNTHIGLLSSLPLLLGSVAELPVIKAMKYHSRKTLVFWGVLVQAIMWLLIIGVGALFFIFNVDHQFAPIALIILFTILTTSGTALHPAWTSWMKSIVPKNYNRYFGTRNKIVGFAAIGSMLVAGLILNYFTPINVYIGFAIIFFIAFIGRAISANLFLKKYEPKLTFKHNHQLGFVQFVRKLADNNFGKFTLFSSFMGLMVAIASPFFAVYMLEDLKLNYLEFTIVSLSSLVVMFLTMPAWGKFSDKYGNYKTLKISGFLIPLVPIMWLATPFVSSISKAYVVPYLVVIEAYSGLVWAAYNLSSVDFIYDSADNELIAPFMAYSSILINFGIFIGALIGGWISSSSIVFMGLSAILVAFLISGIARYVIAFAMLPGIKEVKRVRSFGFNEVKAQLHHISFGKLAKILR